MPLSMDTRPAAYAIIIERGYILLSHLARSEKIAASSWTLPGGGLDPGEQPEETVVREVFEETGFRIALDGILGVHAGYFEPSPLDKNMFCALRIIYRAHTLGGSLTPEREGSTDDAQWIRISDLDRTPHVEVLDVAARLMGYPTAAQWAQENRRELARQTK